MLSLGHTRAGQGGSRRGALLSPGPSEQAPGHGGGTALFTLQSTGGQAGEGSREDLEQGWSCPGRHCSVPVPS